MELSPQQDVYYIDTVSQTDYFIDTVTPSAIQLNKEKIMSIELDGPLYIGSNSMQQQVDQNTADIADLKQDVSDIESDIGNLNDLDTVDKSSVVNAINEALSVLDPTQTADYINNSKGLKSGEVSTNSIILNDIKDYAHSTFDASKFPITGNVKINSSGILTSGSYYDGSNHVDTISLVSNESISSFVCKFKFTPLSKSSSSASYFMLVKADSSNYMRFVQSSANKISFQVVKSGSVIIDQQLVSSATVNKEYNVEVKWENNYYDISIKRIDSSTPTTYHLSGASVFSTTNNMQVSLPTGNQGLFGLLDLSSIEVYANNKPIFTGAKTGIDTIKPDNYTVVGTPTISADGIASGFSGSDYLTTLTFNPSTKAWTIINSFTTGASVTGSSQHFLGNSANSVSAKIGTNGHPVVYLSSNGTSNDIGTITGTYTFLANTKYYVKIDFTGSKYILSYSLDGKTYTETGTAITSSTAVYASATLYIGKGSSSSSGYPFGGSIDLNSFKIYVDGDLIYQPCLKIPYTESKTGSKIADSIYRDRVNDMAEQFGYANYYTLSDTDFTLPQGELYGLIGQRTLRDSYRNGINYWELYSNRDLEQGGSCTSGVEVTFARPFADTNYVLSVPYSTKSGTAFTPTQTGDWIAKGKGLL